MPLTKNEIVDLYRARAKHYNLTANLYYLFGFREQAYRRKAVHDLGLTPGDTVVEIGCGTGLNFPLLQKATGPSGKIIGVDLTDAMLSQAKQRIEENGWSNIELVRSDAAVYEFSKGIDGVLSTFALTLSPDFDRIIRNGCEALKPGKRWVILDLKMPSNWLSHLAPLMISLTRPFGVTEDLMARRPWESIRTYMENPVMTELYGGIAYIATGERRESACQSESWNEEEKQNSFREPEQPDWTRSSD